MVKRQFVNAPPAADENLPASAPKDAVKVEFARRLQAAMLNKGWRQSDLARAAQKHLPAGKKFGRDSISLYIRGKVLPGPVFLDALAKALNMAKEDLIPKTGYRSAGDQDPPLNVRDLEDGNAWLRINQAVPWVTAVKILELLKGDDKKNDREAGA